MNHSCSLKAFSFLFIKKLWQLTKKKKKKEEHEKQQQQQQKWIQTYVPSNFDVRMNNLQQQMEYSLTIKENINSLIFALIMTSHFFTSLCYGCVFYLFLKNRWQKCWKNILSLCFNSLHLFINLCPNFRLWTNFSKNRAKCQYVQNEIVHLPSVKKTWVPKYNLNCYTGIRANLKTCPNEGHWKSPLSYYRTVLVSQYLG